MPASAYRTGFTVEGRASMSGQAAVDRLCVRAVWDVDQVEVPWDEFAWERHQVKPYALVELSHTAEIIEIATDGRSFQIERIALDHGLEKRQPRGRRDVSAPRRCCDGPSPHRTLSGLHLRRLGELGELPGQLASGRDRGQSIKVVGGPAQQVERMGCYCVPLLCRNCIRWGHSDCPPAPASTRASHRPFAGARQTSVVRQSIRVAGVAGFCKPAAALSR